MANSDANSRNQTHVSYGALNLSEFVEIICAEVGANGTTIKVGRMPTPLALHTMVPAQQRTAPVRTLLAEALLMAPRPLSWLLMYGPRTGTYYLDIVPPGTF
jgi:hypothetical protein